MFDCVYPTRTARFGVALVESGAVRLKQSQYGTDLGPIEEGCQCPACCKHSNNDSDNSNSTSGGESMSTGVSRAYLHMLLKENDALASQYVTLHNVSYMMRLMRTMREVCIL